MTAAREARAAVEAERAADPGWSPRPWNDWREQAEADVEALARPERAPEQDPLGFGDLVEETAPE